MEFSPSAKPGGVASPLEVPLCSAASLRPGALWRALGRAQELRGAGGARQRWRFHIDVYHGGAPVIAKLVHIFFESHLLLFVSDFSM